MFIDNEFMSDDAFVEWLAQEKYVLQHTGIKNQHKLYLDGQLYLVNGLERTTRKRLKIEEKPHPSYYKLHPFLADRWERLTFTEYSTLKPGETVYVLYDPLTIKKGVFRMVGPLGSSLNTFFEGRPSMGYYYLPEEPEHELWKMWPRFHRPKCIRSNSLYDLTHDR
jgi:hypothetical protein